jgi:Bacterial TSP3 repeat
LKSFKQAILASVVLSITTELSGAQSDLPAFPGAEGFAGETTGGRGGEVYHVSNLNDSGPGSLREGVERMAKPRTIVFDVGGYIALKSILRVGSNLTLAGQTAPGQGIGLRGSEVSLSGSHNIVIRFVRVRQGLAEKQDKKSAINMTGASDILLDHLSIQWGRWDTIDMNECTNVTVQNCIIGPGIAPQRFGCLCQSENVSFIRNLWISNQSRNPKAKGRVQYVNNVVYNWGVTGYVGGHSAADHDADLINNYFIKGPSSNDSFAGQFKDTDHIFQSGNFADLNRDGELNGRLLTAKDFNFGKDNSPTLVQSAGAMPRILVVADSATVAYQKIVASAGASLHRDSVDRRLIEDLTSLGKRGQTVHDPVELGGFGEIAGGPAPLDTDGDGMPDAWEATHGSNPKLPDGNTLAASGYTRLEDYLNSLATPHEPASVK